MRGATITFTNCISRELEKEKKKKKASLSAGFYHVTLALLEGRAGCAQHKHDFTEQEGVDVGRDLCIHVASKGIVR